MRVNADCDAEIVILAENRVLAGNAMRDLLNKAGIAAISLGEPGGVSIAEKALRVVADVNANWTIVALDSSDGPKYRSAVAQLVAGGVDDVVLGCGKNGPATLANSVGRARTTLALSAAITQTGHIIGSSSAMRAVKKAAAQCVQSQFLPVLILGETGTGKGQIAKAIHDADPLRHEKPFHVLDCGGVTDTLLGSELFGHVRGAYTGALNNRRGALECAGEGTLLLDEIGELSLPAQSYLLNALQERYYRPVGSDQKLAVRCRFVAATNRSLDEDIEIRCFRRDLFYRLNGNCIHMPALRDHASDIGELFSHFLASARKHLPNPDIEPAVIQFLESHEYPGNVRELESIAQQTATKMGDEQQVRLAHLPFDRMNVKQTDGSSDKSVEFMVQQGMQMRDIESEVARQATKAALRFWTDRQPDKSRTQIVKQVARSLGVSARTIYNKLNGSERPS